MAQPPEKLPEDIKTRKVELVLQQLDALPTLPAIVVRLLALTNSHDAKIQEVVQLLGADQTLTGKLLSLAGSAAAGVRVPVTSVQQAVVLLGFETVRNLALSVKVFEIFQQADEPATTNGDGNTNGNPPEVHFKREEFWKHSLAVATAAEMLAGKMGGGVGRLNTADAFVCGLLHDLGKVAFDTVMPKSFTRVVEMATLTRGDIADMERRVIGLDHALAGKRLAEAWNLPQLITQTIWLHGAPPPPLPTVANIRGNEGGGTGVFKSAPGSAGANGIVNLGMVLLVGLADTLVRRQHIGFSGNYLFPYDVEQYTHHLGLSADDIEYVTTHLAETLEARARAIGLYDVESRQLYLASIANANAELGRINQQLAVQNRKLSTRSNCFEMLTRFYQRIVPAASPAQLLAEIGAVAQPFLDAGAGGRLVLFSQDPDQSNVPRPSADVDGDDTLLGITGGSGGSGGVGEVLLFDASQSAHDSFLMNMPPYGGDQRVGRANQNFMRPASPQLDWLLERVRTFLSNGVVGGVVGGGQNKTIPLSQCWFMPLLCGNEPVGGIMWVAKDTGPNALAGVADMILVSQSWGMTLRTAHWREQQMILTEALAASNRDLGAMQQQRIREKSLASLGEMAAGAAHEMNNPLMVISGRAQLLAAKISDAGMKGEASLIAQQADRLSQIITDMMEFAKPVSPRLAPLNLRTIVDEASKAALLRAGLAADDGAIKIHAPDNLPAARGDSRQIQNAMVEVIHNALQAARGTNEPGRQAVTVSLRFDPLDQHIIIQIADRGTGMTQDTVKNAFAPFFSAKSAGRNRGMGLAKALRWIENHGGTIRLDTTLHAGTTAVLLLPLNAELPPQAP